MQCGLNMGKRHDCKCNEFTHGLCPECKKLKDKELEEFLRKQGDLKST